MKDIIISELEYNQLQLTIQELMTQLAKFRKPTLHKKQANTAIFNRLHGILKHHIPLNEKQILEDELLKKYLTNE